MHYWTGCWCRLWIIKLGQILDHGGSRPFPACQLFKDGSHYFIFCVVGRMHGISILCIAGVRCIIRPNASCQFQRCKRADRLRYRLFHWVQPSIPGIFTRCTTPLHQRQHAEWHAPLHDGQNWHHASTTHGTHFKSLWALKWVTWHTDVTSCTTMCMVWSWRKLVQDYSYYMRKKTLPITWLRWCVLGYCWENATLQFCIQWIHRYTGCITVLTDISLLAVTFQFAVQCASTM